ncbi:MAG: hypothetical protein N3A38_14110 [Planctomycetota bacterium]|nr:hypothetical protein [Planctomycetota bacterium]
MILINLLPEERRPVERTPLPRFLTYVAGVLVACLQISVLLSYHMSKIPDAKQSIETAKKAREEQKKIADEVDAIDKEIQRLGNIRKTLGDLESDRVCWGRILDRLCDSVPDNLWLVSLSIQRQGGGESLGAAEVRRYTIKMTGMALGDTDAEARRNVTDFIRNLTKNFKARDAASIVLGSPPGSPPKQDYDPVLGVRAVEPYLHFITKREVMIPEIKGKPSHKKDAMEFATDMTLETIPYSEKAQLEHKTASPKS